MRKAVPILALAVMLGGCAAQHPLHPGAANAFDSNTFDVLLVTHNIIESTKADLAANKFQPNVANAVRTALNNLVVAYNIADTSYLAYHAAAAAGTATPTQQAQLQTQIDAVSSSTTALSNAKVSGQ